MSEAEQIKVHFHLEADEDGFPPISIESLNAFKRLDGSIRLDNTPFFVEGVSLGDVVECGSDSALEGMWFKRVADRSGNQALSIIFLDINCKEEVYQRLKRLGCYCEYGEFGCFHMMAVCVYKDVDYVKVSSFLEEREREEKLSYAELCVY